MKIIRHAADAVSAAIMAVIVDLAARPVRSARKLRIDRAIEVQVPLHRDFSPTFFWSDEADFGRYGSTTCPKGRAITGRLSIARQASLRILESYPDGESVVCGSSPAKARRCASRCRSRLCAVHLPAARKASVLFSQHPDCRTFEPVCAAVGIGRHDQPPGLPQARRSVSGGFGSTRSTGDRRGAPGAELSRPDGWNVRALNGAPAGARRRMRAPTPVCLVARRRRHPQLPEYLLCRQDVLVKAENGERKKVGCGTKARMSGRRLAHG